MFIPNKFLRITPNAHVLTRRFHPCGKTYGWKEWYGCLYHISMNNEYYLEVEKHAGERNGTDVYTRFLRMQNGVLSAIHECQHRTINNIINFVSYVHFHQWKPLSLPSFVFFGPFLIMVKTKENARHRKARRRQSANKRSQKKRAAARQVQKQVLEKARRT